MKNKRHHGMSLLLLALLTVISAFPAEVFADEIPMEAPAEMYVEAEEPDETVPEEVTDFPEEEAAIPETDETPFDPIPDEDKPPFSVTVPANLALTVSENGEVHAAVNGVIANRSSGEVQVTAITVQAENGWELIPYSTNMANAKVDAKQIGFTVNNTMTRQWGSSESLLLGGGWSIESWQKLPLHYDAVVSAMSEPVSEQVLSLVFVLEWAE